MENNKMMKTAGTFETIFKVARGITKACGFVCLVFVVLVLIFGEKIFAEGSLSVDLDFVTFYLAEDYQLVTGAVKLHAVFIMAIGALLCFAAAYICRLLRRIVAPMKDGRPFEESVVSDLRKIGWVIVIGGAVTQVLSIAESIVMTHAYPIEEIFTSDAITKIEYNYTVDFNFVLLACVVFLLSYIFDYGCKLQRESDETL